jgi:Uncharacterized ATPase, putative transposase
MKREEFVETSQVIALKDAVGTAVDAGEGYPGMVMAYGEHGTGKTWAARQLVSDHLGVYVRVMQNMTQAAFLQEICHNLALGRPHGSTRCKQAIISALADERQPVFVDEAERLAPDRLEDLRDIHDITGAPVVLIGEMGLPLLVAGRGRLNDRIPDAFRVHFGDISNGDIMMYAKKAANLRLSPDAASYIGTFATGNFRRVYNAMLSLKAAARAAGTGDIDAELARKTLKAAKDKAEQAQKALKAAQTKKGR